jgi:hypothetical protein
VSKVIKTNEEVALIGTRESKKPKVVHPRTVMECNYCKLCSDKTSWFLELLGHSTLSTVEWSASFNVLSIYVFNK